MKKDQRMAFRTTKDTKERLEKMAASRLYHDRKPAWLVEHYAKQGLKRDERKLKKGKK